MGINTAAVQRLYVAYFNRPADPRGLAKFEAMLGDTAAGQEELAAISGSFSGSSEYKANFDGLSNPQIVNKLYQNIFGRSADLAGLNKFSDDLDNGTHTVESLALYLSYAAQGTDKTVVDARIEASVAFTSGLDTAEEVLAYSGLDAAAEGRAYLEQISGALPTTDSAITAQKTSAVANVDSSIADMVEVGGAAGTAFTLTTGSDAFTGGADRDTFTGAVSTASTTLNISDVLDGKGGTDKLVVTYGTLGGATTALQSASVSGIEQFEFKNVSSKTISQDFALVTGETSVAVTSSTDLVDVTNLAAGTGVDVVGNGSVTNGATSFGYVATATAADVDIKDGTTAGNITLVGAGLTSVSVDSTGAANTIGTLALPAAVTALTISGATKLTTGTITDTALASITITGTGGADINAGALSASVDTIDGSAATGAIEVTAGDVAANVDPGTEDVFDLTITTGSGNDAVDVQAVGADDEVSVSTGLGDDTVTIGDAIANSSATLAGDVIDGGDGTDILAMTTAVASGQAVATNTISGFEELTITNAATGSTTLTFFDGGISTVNLADGSNNATLVGGAGSLTVNVQAANAAALTISDGALTGTGDVANIVNEATTTDVFAGKAITSTGYETVNITTTGAGATNAAAEQDFGAITVTADTGGTATLNFSGTNRVDADGVITAQVVDASGLTAQTTGQTFDMTANAMVGLATGVNTLTGSDGADVLIGDADDTTNISAGAGNDAITGGSDAETINGGAGNDTIAGGGGADTINGDAGKDQITLAAGAQVVDAGAGDDTVVAAGNLAFGQTIAGGADTDILSVNAGVSSGDGSVVSGFEVLSAANLGTHTLTNFGNNTFTTATIGALGASTFAGVSTETIQVTGIMTGDLTVTLANATGTSDSLALNFSSTAGITATKEVVAAGVETINLSVTDTDLTSAEQNTIQLTVAAATTLNISGDQGVTLAGSGDITKLTTLDASGMVLGAVTETGLTLAASNTQVGGVMSITGSNGIDNITGTAVTADTVILGSGADTVTFSGTNAVADTYTGGAGVDTYVVGSTTAGSTTTATQLFTITDAADGDIINLAAATTKPIDNINAAAWDALEVVLGSSATFTNYLDGAAAGDGATAKAKLGWFVFGGDTYIVVDQTAGATFTAATDQIIKLSGVVDIDQSTVTAEVLTFAST